MINFIYMHNLKAKNKTKISIFVLLCFLCVILFQTSIFSISLRMLDTGKDMERSIYLRIFNIANDRAKRIEAIITSNWSNTTYMKQVSNIARKKYENSSKDKNKITFDTDTAILILNMMDNMMVSGAFVAMPTHAGNNNFDNILFLQDSSVGTHSMNMYDITLLSGNQTIADNLNIVSTKRFKKGLKFHRDLNYDFDRNFLKIISAYKKDSSNSNNGGLWYTSKQLFDIDGSNMYFISPIFDEKTMKIYGFIGIEIDVEKQILPLLDTSELSSLGDKSAYILAKDLNNSSSYVIASRDEWGKIKNNDILQYNILENKYYQVDKMPHYMRTSPQFSTNDEVSLLSMKIPIHINMHTDSHYTQDLYLIPIFQDTEILVNSKKLNNNILYTTIFSMIVSIALAYLVSLQIAIPIKKISSQINDIDDINNIIYRKN